MIGQTPPPFITRYTPPTSFPWQAINSPTKPQLELVQAGLSQFAPARTAFSQFPLSTQLQNPADDWLVRAAGERHCTETHCNPQLSYSGLILTGSSDALPEAHLFHNPSREESCNAIKMPLFKPSPVLNIYISILIEVHEKNWLFKLNLAQFTSSKWSIFMNTLCMFNQTNWADGYSQAENNSLTTTLASQHVLVQQWACLDSDTECVMHSFSLVNVMTHTGKLWVTSPWALIKCLWQAQNKPGNEQTLQLLIQKMATKQPNNIA